MIWTLATGPRPESLEIVVDALLASTAFRMRWGRHWLNVAGYAGTLGLGRRAPPLHAIRYSVGTRQNWGFRAMSKAFNICHSLLSKTPDSVSAEFATPWQLASKWFLDVRYSMVLNLMFDYPR